MDPPHVHKMVSFGHCEKVDAGDGQAPIGHYGNGFKSGSMRVGRDAVVFTSDSRTRTVALLSQSYLAAIRAVEVLVPMVLFSFFFFFFLFTFLFIFHSLIFLFLFSFIIYYLCFFFLVKYSPQ